MTTIVFVIEESSKQEFLSGVLARLNVPEHMQIHFRVAEGHIDVLRELREITRRWRVPDTRFVVLCDQDSADCIERKHELLAQIPPSRLDDTVVRIVCTELEGWYLTDAAALRDALPGLSDRAVLPPELRGPPDGIHRPARKLAERTWFAKNALARSMGQRISIAPGASHSFNLFLQTLNQILADPQH